MAHRCGSWGFRYFEDPGGNFLTSSPRPIQILDVLVEFCWRGVSLELPLTQELLRFVVIGRSQPVYVSRWVAPLQNRRRRTSPAPASSKPVVKRVQALLDSASPRGYDGNIAARTT